MPVYKFRSIEEMNKAPAPELRGSNFERFLRHCARWWSIAPKALSAGRVQVSHSRRGPKGSRDIQVTTVNYLTTVGIDENPVVLDQRKLFSIS